MAHNHQLELFDFFIKPSLSLFRNYAWTTKGTLEGVVRTCSAGNKPERLWSLHSSDPIAEQHSFGSLAIAPVREMKILIADDNDAIRTGLCEFLERSDPGYHCEAASDGDEALAKAKASKPDIVVLDMLMPGMSGLAAARLISDRLPATKILLHTVHGSGLLSANAARYGVFRVVDKTDGKNLLAAIREVVPSPQRATS